MQIFVKKGGLIIFCLEEKEGVKYFTVEEFQKTGLIDYVFTSRVGGVSKQGFSELNLGLHVADEKEAVIKNRKIAASLVKSKLKYMVAGEQVHGTKIRKVTRKDLGKGARDYSTALAKTDALMTDTANILLSSYYADCTPLSFLDPVNQVVALAHAGWKGTLDQIAEKMVDRLKKVYDTKAEQLLVAVGPAIGECCYQVGPEVAELFKSKFDYADRLLQQDKAGKYFFNLKKANIIQLKKAGLKNENIIINKLCTFCNDKLFFSYRRDGTKTGRMTSLIKLK